jgi:putative endonuclease
MLHQTAADIPFPALHKCRFASHQKGQVQSTKAYCPVKLRSYVAVETETKARELEKYFKSGSGKAIALKRFL